MKVINTPFLRYLLAGGTAFVSEYLSFLILFSLVSVQLVIANILSFLIGLLTSFTLNKLWVFGNSKQTRPTHQQLLLYVVLATINLCFTSYAITELVSTGVAPAVAKIILMLLVVTWNFVIFKRLIFVHNDRL